MQDTIGVVPRQLIAEMIGADYVQNASADCLQACSLELSLTEECYRLSASILPNKNELVETLLKNHTLFQHNLEQPLELNGIYLVRLSESLALPKGIHANAATECSASLINLRTRLIADGIPHYNTIPNGYSGSLWLEIIPKSFAVRIHPKDRLHELRFFHGDSKISIQEQKHLIEKNQLHPSLELTSDLSTDDLIGWRALSSNSTLLDTAFIDHDPFAFFEPLTRPKYDELLLEANSFHLITTRERLTIPSSIATKIITLEPRSSTFLKSDWNGTQTIGISNQGQNTLLRDGQTIGLLAYEKLIAFAEPIKSESKKIIRDGPQLAKWFKPS